MLLEKLFDIFTPHDCLVCKQESRLVCAWCWPDVFEAVPDRCYSCKKMVKDTLTCTKCRKRTPLQHVWASTIYDTFAKDLVVSMKYQQHRQAAYLIAQKLDETLPYLEDLVVTHVPTATSRLRQRGFDHSKLIAREFAHRRRLAYVPLLARVSQLRQVGTSREQRIKQAEGTYRPINLRHLSKRHILLIDDVLTTGATIEEAARTLKRAGAKSVDAAIFAQAI